jgi:shikimate kinase
MEHLCRQGTTVYLKLSLERVAERVKNITTRGLVIEKNQKLADIYALRAPLYARYARVTIDCDAMGPEDVVQALVNALAP